MKRAFVTGWPVAHSRSPIIHNHWLDVHGIDGIYEKAPCEPELFAAFMSGFHEQGFAGGNVTLPFKEEAFKLADKVDAVAKAIGAANTVWWEEGKLHASNTDAYGFLANLDQQAAGWDSDENISRGALVLGAGGAARAIVYGLVERGFRRVAIANRTVSKARKLADDFGARCTALEIVDLPLDTADMALVVNTTSVGMGDGELPADPAHFGRDTLIHDIVYTPMTTPFLAAGQKAGLKTVDGLGMLLHQAVPGFERWFGVRPQVTDALRALVIADLETGS